MSLFHRSHTRKTRSVQNLTKWTSKSLLFFNALEKYPLRVWNQFLFFFFFLQTDFDLLHNSGLSFRDMDIREIVLYRFQKKKTDLSSLAAVRLFGIVAIHVELRSPSDNFNVLLLSEHFMRHPVRWLFGSNLLPIRNTGGASEKCSTRRV